VRVKFLYVMDPLDRINVAGDSTYMLMRECSRRGMDVAWCTPDDLYALRGQTWARVQAVRTTAEAPHFHRGVTEDQPLGAFDVVWMRKDPPFDMSYVFSTYLLELVPPKTLVLNRPASLRSFNEKLFAQAFPELGPDTLVSRDPERIVAFVEAQPERAVLKPWDGNGGRGVVLTHPGDRNLRALIELLTENGRVALLAQAYVPAIAEGDKRIILVDGVVAGAMLRVPGEKDHRGNMHVGASVRACGLTAADRRITDTLSPRLREEGLVFVGIDVIGGLLTEINVTSPTGIQEIDRLDGVRIEEQVIDASVARWKALVEGRKA
jgi:glutathione synthase